MLSRRYFFRKHRLKPTKATYPVGDRSYMTAAEYVALYCRLNHLT